MSLQRTKSTITSWDGSNHLKLHKQTKAIYHSEFPIGYARKENKPTSTDSELSEPGRTNPEVGYVSGKTFVRAFTVFGSEILAEEELFDERSI